ncbi:hypothetical protein SteCoe_11928 [Stentor coeruleus]|uniref:Uncharacterized protein n=1 Tax=Stentor coeruleus TaxID=5963 RepID=A0A1R2CBZ8_9CILI|nr:hypothetical protein SteCoe_11928 [Stentor coeruleus]
MENKVYKFSRIIKRKHEESITKIISKKILPELKIKNQKTNKIKSILGNYGNVYSPYTLKKKASLGSQQTSLTPKLRIVSSNMIHYNRGSSVPYKMRIPPAQKVSIRYMCKDFEDVEQVNIMKTPDDSLNSTKNRGFFREPLPMSKDLLKESYEIEQYLR